MGCSVYDESLLQGGAGGEGAGGAGGAAISTCSFADECPGWDNECQIPTCDEGECSLAFQPSGQSLHSQVFGDCRLAICDGQGKVESVADDNDVPTSTECMDASCDDGTPVEAFKDVGTVCSLGVCSAQGECVECVSGEDCESGLCEDGGTCADSSCGDGSKNGKETDVDCGGGKCVPCQTEDTCEVNEDCIGGLCTDKQCAPTCSDTIQNENETDVDCGGDECGRCTIGNSCLETSDCVAGTCEGNICVCSGANILISEVRTRGAAGGNDDFVELYNPTSAAVTLDSQWKLEWRSYDNSVYATRWQGSGDKLQPFHHYLIVGSAYAQTPATDGFLTSGVSDAGSVRLVHAGDIVDALCLYYSATTLNALSGDSFSCEGTPINNAPHNNDSSGNLDVSVERGPTGALGNCIDTEVNASDFVSSNPATPQNTADLPTPN